ncbi:hypothetical protein LEN26_015263, partial [Aphanomyces euteiches]
MPTNTRGVRLTLLQKQSMRDYHKANQHLTMADVSRWAAEQFNKVPDISNVRRILKDTRDYKTINIDTAKANSRFNMYPPKHIRLDKAMNEWVVNANDKNVAISGELIKHKAQQLAQQLNLQNDMKFSNGWLYRLQQRHNLKMFRLHGEAGSVDPVVIEEGREMLRAVTQSYELDDIYNMDETGVFYN